MKLLLVLILAILCVNCCSSQQRPTEPSSYIPNELDSTAALVLEREPGLYVTYCTAVFINKTQLLTAYHCANPERHEDLQLKTYREGATTSFPAMLTIETHHARLIASAPEKDLALIELTGTPPSHSVALLSDHVEVGAHVEIIGHPSGIEFSYTEGLVSAKRYWTQDDHKQSVLQVSAAVWFGNSGGGAFYNGRLCGIASFITPNTPNVSFFTDINDIHQFLDSIPNT